MSIIDLDHASLNGILEDANGPVAFHLKQKMVPVEGPDAVFFPPTFAGGGYCIDELSDGTKVALIDSVGAQANRLEPLFKQSPEGKPKNPLADLVPQIEIELPDQRRISILETGHRLGDALVRSSSLADAAQSAFADFLKDGDASGIAKLAPTSLVFGVWDSRETQAKLPRLVQSTIRAWDVTQLHRSAQYFPPVNYADLEVFSEQDREKSEGDNKSALAQRGYVAVPSVGDPGGIVSRGGIFRNMTINLIALRKLTGPDENALHRYVFGLAAVSATAPLDGFIRQGCLLTPDPDASCGWMLVHRDGSRDGVTMTYEFAMDYASAAAVLFEVGESGVFEFDKSRATADARKKKD